MSVSRRLCLTALATLALGVALPALADTYTVTDLGTLPGKANSWTWIHVINNKGVIAAYANDNPPNPNAFAGDSAFLWYAGKTIPLPGLPGATDTMAVSLNDHNQAVGYSGADGFEQIRAVLWHKGKVIDLGTYGDDPYSQALAINNRGQIVGLSFTHKVGIFNGQHAVVWEKGQCHLLPPLNGGGFDGAGAINNKGQIVGLSNGRPVLWQNRHSAPLDLGVDGAPSFINDKGQIAGGAIGPDGRLQAFLWDKGTVHFLGIIGDDIFSYPYDINNKGQIVGASTQSFEEVDDSTAVLWENGALIDLNTRIPANSGWKLLAGSGINEKGEIAGYGVYNGQFRAFLLTPTKK